MPHNNKKKRNPERLRLADDLQPHQLARCYRELVVKPKHDTEDNEFGRVAQPGRALKIGL